LNSPGSAEEDEDLLLALAQRRNANLHDVEAIVEVFTELTAGERLLEIAIGRRHDPGVHVDHPVASDAGEAESCRTCRSLAWRAKGMLGDLVEVDRPLWAYSNWPGFCGAPRVNAPFSWPKSSDSRSPAGNRGAVDLDEGATAASPGSARTRCSSTCGCRR